jgi:hypothetical protein
VVDGPKFLKLLHGCSRAAILQIKAIQLGEKRAQIEEVDQHSNLFQEPKGLLQARAHDHKIPILLGQGPVSVRPHRYPFYKKIKKNKKIEIEHQVAALLNFGVVRASTSPYSLLVQLVKKMMGSGDYALTSEH